MSENVKMGVVAALAHVNADDAARALGAQPAAEEQLDLLENERLDALLPLQQHAKSGPLGGRPKGSMNKRTEAMRDYLLKKYGNPLEGLASLAFRPTGDLIREMNEIAAKSGIKIGATVMDVLQFQRGCFDALAPYVAQKMPTAVEIDARTANMLVIGTLNSGSGEGAALSALGIDLGVPVDMSESVINQTLNNDECEKSDAKKSDDIG